MLAHLMSLDFCSKIWMVASDFGVFNMKASILPWISVSGSWRCNGVRHTLDPLVPAIICGYCHLSVMTTVYLLMLQLDLKLK